MLVVKPRLGKGDDGTVTLLMLYQQYLSHLGPRVEAWTKTNKHAMTLLFFRIKDDITN